MGNKKQSLILLGLTVCVLGSAAFFIVADKENTVAQVKVEQSDSSAPGQKVTPSALSLKNPFATAGQNDFRNDFSTQKPDSSPSSAKAASMGLPVSEHKTDPADQRMQNAEEKKPAILPELPPEMIAEIERLSNSSSDGLYEEYHSDGSVHMDLQGRFQSVPIAVIDSNGEMHTFMHGDAYKPGPIPDAEEHQH
ncbi:MAG: hypothetical protein KDI30_03415 [Pseudomonadales bacterium]|nr:hypothetical protein [Pseudomonadales bacterium]